VTGNE